MTEGVCQGAGWGKAPWKLLSSLVWGSKWSVTQQKLVSVPTENIFFSYFNLHNTDKSHIPAKGMKNLSFLPSWEHKMTFRMSISLFPGGSVVKNPPANVGDAGSIPRSWRYPGGGNGNPLRYSLPGKSHGQRSLAGYSPWGCTESDMTEWQCWLKSESESHSVVSDSLWSHGLYHPWNSSGQNTGVGSLSLLQGIFQTQGSCPGLPHCRQILSQLSHKRSPRILEWVAYPFSRGSSRPRNQTGVSCIAGRFFTTWAIREVHNIDWPLIKVTFSSLALKLHGIWWRIFLQPLCRWFKPGTFSVKSDFIKGLSVTPRLGDVWCPWFSSWWPGVWVLCHSGPCPQAPASCLMFSCHLFSPVPNCLGPRSWLGV